MIGEHIRVLRENQNLLLRELAATLRIDTAMLSKMERGLRPFRKEDIKPLSNILKENESKLYTLWLADKILRVTDNDKFTSDALEIALMSCKQNNMNQKNR
ncbi:helix-turn-helix transcriptional regulator [uncultured Maribacter sp.]|uniref:helix-turn-helix domain-containing protein n=1 Tax=uncultured Maribacter sp. TaxID=431308 RepID=UPI00260600FF|nr:helix-turn-helix transcriptional regulator [uncultured Maribacter sp.]